MITCSLDGMTAGAGGELACLVGEERSVFVQQNVGTPHLKPFQGVDTRRARLQIGTQRLGREFLVFLSRPTFRQTREEALPGRIECGAKGVLPRRGRQLEVRRAPILRNRIDSPLPFV